MDTEKVLEFYHEHYKETNELNNAAKKRRNKSFVILCVLEAISFMLTYNPELISDILNEAIRGKFSSTIMLSVAVLQTLVWILIAYVLSRYVQDVLYVEHQYTYLDNLEKEIRRMLGKESVFSREGAHYLKDYPIVLNLIDLFYKMLCPVLFAGINIAHIVLEWQNYGNLLPIVIDSLICFAIFFFTWFYFFGIHTKMTQWCVKHIPGVKWISEKLHKLLKEV